MQRDARTAFYIDPQDIDKIGKYMDKGYEVGTIYHSHTETTAHFSASDKSAALENGKPSYPEAFYAVLSVVKYQAVDFKAYASDHSRRDFDQVWPKES